MKKNSQSGFTLIELLVVIAIIGILASVVLASLNSARNKGADAKIKSQLANMRAQAQLYTGSGTAFTANNCPTAGTNLFFDTDASNSLKTLFNGLTITTAGTLRCGAAGGLPSAGSAWAVAARTTTGAWCVDSTGASRDKKLDGTTLYGTTLTTAIAASGTSCQ